jgi:hypothetical protein
VALVMVGVVASLMELLELPFLELQLLILGEDVGYISTFSFILIQ